MVRLDLSRSSSKDNIIGQGSQSQDENVTYFWLWMKGENKVDKTITVHCGLIWPTVADRERIADLIWKLQISNSETNISRSAKMLLRPMSHLQFCRAAMSRYFVADTVAVCNYVCRTLQLCRINKNWRIWCGQGAVYNVHSCVLKLCCVIIARCEIRLRWCCATSN